MAEEEPKPEVVKVEKKNNVALTKWVVGILFVLLWTVLIIVKTQNAGFPLGTFIIIGVFLTIVAVVLFFGFDIYRKIKKAREEKENSESLPAPALDTIVKEKIKEIVESPEYRNHIKKFNHISPHNINKNLIYNVEIEPLYKEPGKEKMCIIINANYIDRCAAVLWNASPYEVNKIINVSSSNPEVEPDVERIMEENRLLGTERTIERKVHKRKENKGPEKKEDLA